MLLFPRWLSYRDEVLEHLGALLVMYPRGRQFSADFPWLRSTLKSHFKFQMRPSGSAAEIAAVALGELVQQLSPEQRTKLHEQIEAMKPEDVQVLVSNQLSRQSANARDQVTFAANLIGAAIFIARRMASEGTLHPEDLRTFLREVEACVRADTAAAVNAIGARPNHSP